MNLESKILKRFIIYMAILTFVMFTVWGFVKSFMNRPPGDYETEVCDIRLKDKKYFIAERILAKHDENYMPPEVSKALEKSN